jgi:hypothetical protein
VTGAAAPPSATLAINERIERRIRDGADVLHLAFGEAGLPTGSSATTRPASAAPPRSFSSEDPASLPWIRGALERLRDALA